MGAEARAVAFVCAAEILGLAGFSLVPALLPQFIATWPLSNAQAGWLAGMMSGGYMAGVLPLVALTDRMSARTIYLACSALSALSCFGIALSDSVMPALVWRAKVSPLALRNAGTTRFAIHPRRAASCNVTSSATVSPSRTASLSRLTTRPVA